MCFPPTTRRKCQPVEYLNQRGHERLINRYNSVMYDAIIPTTTLLAHLGFVHVGFREASSV